MGTIVVEELQTAKDRNRLALLRMSALMHDALYDGFGMRPDTPGPVEQTWGVPALDGLVGRRHVGIHGGVPARCVVADMTGNAGTAVKQLNSGCRQPGIDARTGEAVGNRVVVLDELDVIVDTQGLRAPAADKAAPLALSRSSRPAAGR